MTTADRFRRALLAFRGDSFDQRARAPRAPRPVQMVDAGNYNKPQWNMLDLESFVQYGFNLNAVIYASLSYKAEARSSAPLRAYTGDKAKPKLLDDNHPLSLLLAQPNLYQSALEFDKLNTIYYGLAGNAYIYMSRPRTSDLPEAMYTFRPDRVKILVSVENGMEVIGYLYVPPGKSDAAGIPMLAEDVMHVKTPNPGDPLGGFGFGLSPLSPAAQSANVDNDVTKFLKVFFQHGAMFQNVLSYDAPMDADEMATVRERFEEVYGGVDNWGKVVVMSQGGKVARVNPTFEEMGFDSIDERNESRILMSIGVPALLIYSRLGLVASTNDNVVNARRVFWEDRLLAELRLFEGKFQKYLSQNGAFPAYDLTEVPALRRDIKLLTEAAGQLIDRGVPPRIAFDTVGLSVADYDGQDEPYQPGGALPTTPPPNMAETQPEPVAEQSQRQSLTDYETKAVQRATEATAAWLGRFGDAAAQQFERDKRECQALIAGAQKAAYRRKATIGWEPLTTDILKYLQDTSLEQWRQAFIPMVKGLITDNADEWAAALGVQFDVRNLEAEKWFQEYVLKFSQAISDTSSQVVKDLIAQAMAEGWSASQLEERLGLVFDQWMMGDLSPEDLDWLKQRMPSWRRELIARTETMRSYNTGSYNLGKDWGAQEKSWLAYIDDRTRDSHKTANNQRVKIDAPFIVGGSKMLHPHDMTLGAPLDEVADCRCTVLMYM